MLNILPGVFLVLLAYSVKHIITTGQIMDTILYGAVELIRQSPPLAAAFLVYATTLAMNFFIGSASAKAFLMMPILTPPGGSRGDNPANRGFGLRLWGRFFQHDLPHQRVAPYRPFLYRCGLHQMDALDLETPNSDSRYHVGVSRFCCQDRVRSFLTRDESLFPYRIPAMTTTIQR
jgi:hypothetical protein